MTKWTTSARRIAQDYTMAPNCAERIEDALILAEAQGYQAGYEAAMVSVVVDTVTEKDSE